MLKLVETEFLKLRRRKLPWVMLLAAFVMPFFAFLFYSYLGKKGVDPLLFYKMSALGFTMFIILPVILGVLSTILMYDENQYDMLKQLWIVPVSKLGYFFSKFFVIALYSVAFMLLTAVGSIVFSVLPGIVAFSWGSAVYLFQKCLEIGVLCAFGVLPILAVAASQKGYILPVCAALVYAFLSFFLMSFNMYLHPLSSMAAIVMRNNDIPGLAFTGAPNLPLAFLCMGVWGAVSVWVADAGLKRK